MYATILSRFSHFISALRLISYCPILEVETILKYCVKKGAQLENLACVTIETPSQVKVFPLIYVLYFMSI